MSDYTDLKIAELQMREREGYASAMACEARVGGAQEGWIGYEGRCNWCANELSAMAEQVQAGAYQNCPKDASDGYHTFEELYEHRHALFLALCAAKEKLGFATWRSKLHHDGTMDDGWFIAGLENESGLMITYHLPIRLWDKCGILMNTFERAPEWDGHTSMEVIERVYESMDR